MRLRFLGGAGTVTGSKYLLEAAGQRILVDCGLFQGLKDLRLKNWAHFPVPPSSIDSVILTHAHLDHSGYIPVLLRNGFKGRIHTTAATRDLCRLLLPDSGHLMERDAEYANRHGFSKHHPARPLYTEEEGLRAIRHFRTHPFREMIDLGGGFRFRFQPAGHILGAAIVELFANGAKIVFSGDLGRPGAATMIDPSKIAEADYLLVESTYGDRLHGQEDPEDVLSAVIGRVIARGGSVLIPVFAVGRAQTLLYYLHRLKAKRRIPDAPVYLDSPMAIDATGIFCDHVGEHRLSASQCASSFGVARYVMQAEDSKMLDHNGMPKIILSASGMATGGRVLHHLNYFAPNPKNLILFTGFQAAGTRGARMLGGEREVKIHGRMVPVNAEIANLDMLSAHADQAEIMGWLKGFARPPRMTFITHGEHEASRALAQRIESDLGWTVTVPAEDEQVMLS